MKLLLMLLLMTFGANAQKQVFNVQQYCIDEKPFQTGQCDILGNEYSFVFVDNAKKEVALYLSDTKLGFTIISFAEAAAGTVYSLKSEAGLTEMTINKSKNKISFIGDARQIRLTVGKSTKLS